METPKNLKKILIAVEDSVYSDKAVEYGINLANLVSAEIALVHVTEIPVSTPYVADPLMNETPAIMPEMMDIQQDATKRLMSRINEKFGSDKHFTTFSKIGNTKDEILLAAEEWPADMIILGTHGRTGFDHFISGSVSESVVRKAKCPVLVIPNPEASA